MKEVLISATQNQKSNMKKTIFTSLFVLLASMAAFAQNVKVGDIAPDFTLTDINGQSHHLYSYLDSGYAVIIDVSAAWCGPCWSAHNSHVFDKLTDHYGTNGTIQAKKIKVLFIEGEATNTTAQLHGTSSGSSTATYSQGDWVTGTNYPFIDNTSVNKYYLYGGFPSFTVICRDRIVRSVNAGYGSTMGNESYWLDIVNQGCPSYAPSSTVDAKPVVYTGIPFFICNASPQLSFQNYSKTQTITSATIKVKSGTTVVATYPWTGSLAPMAKTTVTIPSFAGSVFTPYNFEVVVAGDSYPANNVSDDSLFSIFSSGNATTGAYKQDFEASDDLPGKMISSDQTIRPFKAAGSYVLTGADGNIGRALLFGFPEMNTGESEEVIIGNFNTSAATTLSLDFDYSYANVSGKNDDVDVLVSKDCGTTWTSVWKKSGATLSTTAPPASGAFVPKKAADWKHAKINLIAQKSSNMILKVKGTNDGGHYAFMDNINIDGQLAVNNFNTVNNVSLSPNPASNYVNVNFNLERNETVMIKIIDATGRVVSVVSNSVMNHGKNQINIPTNNLTSGIYSVSIETEEGKTATQFTIVK